MRCPSWLSIGGCEVVNGAALTDALTYQRSMGKRRPVAVSCVECVADRIDPCVPDYLRYWTDPVGTPTPTLPTPTPLPWYRSDQPASSEFLGFAFSEPPTGLGSPISRNPTLRSGGGSYAGPVILSGREMTFRLTAVAMTPRGLAWGLRWLEDLLTSVGSCDTRSIDFRLLCPADGADWSEGVWRANRVALTQIARTDFGDASACVEEITFTLLAEDPWLSQCPRICAAMAYPSAKPNPCDTYDPCETPCPPQVDCDTLRGECGEWCTRFRICCSVRPNNIGREAVRVRLLTDKYGAGPVLIRAYPDPDGLACPPSCETTPLREIALSVPANSEVIVDSATRMITVTSGDTGLTTDGSGLVHVGATKTHDWLIFDGCDSWCVCVETWGECNALRLRAEITVVHQELAAA